MRVELKNNNNNNKEGELENFGYTVSELTTQWLTRWLRSKTWLSEAQFVTHFTSQRIGEGYGFTTLLYRIQLHFSDNDNDNVVRCSLFPSHSSPLQYYN